MDATAMLAVAAVLAVVTLEGAISPWLLLGVTFAAVMLPRVRVARSTDQIVVAASLMFATSCAACALVSWVDYRVPAEHHDEFRERMRRVGRGAEAHRRGALGPVPGRRGPRPPGRRGSGT